MRKCLIFTVSALMIVSCGLYPRYSRPDVEVTFEEDVIVPGWREMFPDPYLQRLIEMALQQATSLQVATLKVEEADAALQKARGLFLPSLTGNGSADLKYGEVGAGLNASWQVDIFGKVRNASMAAQSSLIASKAYEQAVLSSLIATVAQSYYTLQVLDSQLEISIKTLDNWDRTISVLESLKAAGKTNSIAILQAKAKKMNLESSSIGIRGGIETAENSLKTLIGVQDIPLERNGHRQQVFPIESLDIPLRAVASRPDVREAEMELAAAFYNVAGARSSFYPDITLSGNASWAGNGNGPAWAALGNLVAPVLNHNANKAALRTAKARQEEARLSFRQALLDAGEEVNNAIVRCKVASEKLEIDTRQRNALAEAVEKIELTMKYSSTNYLEVLTAQQSLLDSELGIISDLQSITSARIALYQALGGGASKLPY